MDADELISLREDLDALLDDIAFPNRVVFVSGYVGNGKSTFIRSYMAFREQYQHIYHDFQEKRPNYVSNGNIPASIANHS